MIGVGVAGAGVAARVGYRGGAAAFAEAAALGVLHRSSSQANGSGTTINCSKPAGARVGDVLVASWASRADVLDADMDLPANWVQVAYLDANQPTMKLAYRVVGENEPSSYDFVMATSVAHSVAIECYRGVDTTNPSDVTPTTNSGTSGTTMTATGLTTVTPGAMLIAAFANSVVSATAITDPSDMTERSAVTAQCRITVSEALVADAGATGNKTATQGSTARWGAILWALRPANVEEEVTADVTVTVGETPLMTSKMVPGVSYVKNPVFFNQAGWNNAKVALGNSVGVHNLHIHSFGMADCWVLDNPTGWENGTVTVPVPSTPNRLTGANNRMLGALAKIQEIRATDPDAIFMVTLYNIPWWMKGILKNDGTTLYPIPISDPLYDYDAFTDEGRPMYQNLPYFRLLVKEVAKLAMASPYNVRWFQVWNEAKGFFNNRDQIGQKYEMDFLTGDTTKAELGYGYVYLEAEIAIREGADELEIPRSEIMVGAPYTNMRTDGANTSITVPSSGYPLLYDRVYGTWKKAATQGIETFLDGIAAGVATAVSEGRLPGGTTVADVFQFLCFDFGPRNTDGIYPTNDPWLIATKYTDLMDWANAELDAHGMTGLPIVGSEVYKYVPNIDLDTADPRLLIAFATEVYCRLLVGGMTYPLAWGSDSEASDTTNTADWMITSPATSGGGTQLEWGEINGWFRDHFGPGTEIFEVTSDDGSVYGIASATKMILVHHEGTDRNADVEGEVMPFTGYEVRLMDRG